MHLSPMLFGLSERASAITERAGQWRWKLMATEEGERWERVQDGRTQPSAVYVVGVALSPQVRAVT